MASQAATAVVVDSVVMKILHAHSFARTSSQAMSVLSNLLTRYLVLLASACGQFSELAGRSSLTIHDFVACLDELGTNLDELSEYCGTEGVELSRYASSSAKRLDDLGDFRCYIGEGLVPRDDPIPLHYAPLSEDASVIHGITEDDEESDSDGAGLVPVEAVNHFTEPLSYRQHPTAAFLPDFLPPFPDASQPQPPSPAPAPHTVIMERPSSPLPQHITSITAGDYLIQVPYSESVLAGTPSWHLPSEPSETRPSKPQPPRFSTPSPQQALLAAYHHILTHPVSQPGPPNPAKHKVAMALLSQVQQNTRWDAPSTLYANVTPCPPRVTSIGPSYPIALSALEDLRSGKDANKESDKRPLLPPAPPRPVFTNDRPVFLSSQQASRLPELARQVLPGPVLSRTTRLTHPPVLQRGSQKLCYGPGVPAPWNSSLSMSAAQGGKGGEEGGTTNGQDATSFTLPDAKIYATWDYETKQYSEPLGAGRRGRVSAAPIVSLSSLRPSK
ncbi:hypothetical protein JVT61DRAFT_7389 [Boletus reticuloceps]|uniref:Bromodomain associated domain-containing protein n=1 Tax=Boletus reticuloceps TaxID=495285 RepID=A0A8I2YJ74_9AGAM|nr:hypothetical protein JVT61DRAFT_7389 [Boletus reticuloceps]